MEEPYKIGTELFFLQNLADKAETNTRHVDSQSSILIGLCTAIFAFSIRDHGVASIPFTILAIFSGLAAVLSLASVHPPEFMRKRGQKESILYKHAIRKFPNEVVFAEALQGMMADQAHLYHEYALAIYNTHKYYYQPKRRLYNLARDMLIIGVLLSLTAFIFVTGGIL